MALAIFDIDGTLVTGPGTEKRFFVELLRHGCIGPRQLAAFGIFLLCHGARFGRHVLKKNKAYLAGLDARDVQRLALDWVSAGNLEPAWFKPCLARLHWHRQCGDTVVLLSGTPQFIATAIGSELGAHEAIGSGCMTRNGRFCAAVPCPHPFAGEKRAALDAIVSRHGVVPADIIAYADSVLDLPLLEAVGRAVAVRPDEDLHARALPAGWEVMGPVRRRRFPRLAPRLDPVRPAAGSRR